MTEVGRILDQLRRSHEGEAWHGPAPRELLDGVTADQAARMPLPSAHNIHEIVLHIAFWAESAADALRGVPMPAEGSDWPAAQPGETGWRSAIVRLDTAQADLQRETEKLGSERLGDIVPGRDYTVYFLLHGIAQHNIYHAGQIALLKKS